MGVAAAVVQQHGIADVIQRRAVLPGGQRAKRRAGEILQAHAVSFSRNGEPRLPEAWGSHRRPNAACKPLKTIQVAGNHKSDVYHITRSPSPPHSLTTY